MVKNKTNLIKYIIQRFIPAHFNDPSGLFLRLVRSRDPAAVFAIKTSIMALLALPLDLLMENYEKKLYRNASAPDLPVIFVTGPARSGTSVVAQVLVHNLAVTYMNNLTAVFQRSPITANLLFGKWLKKTPTSYTSYYGKTANFSGPNDGLHIWDRWVGKDRTQIPEALSNRKKHEMITFLGAWENVFKKPLINKNNNLNTFAHLVADVFENAYFICLTREPAYLAQSLLKARTEIHGNVNVPYGLQSPRIDGRENRSEDFIQDVCEQVLFHEKMIMEQQQRIGTQRFWIVSYENFCSHPAQLVMRVAEEILQKPIDEEKLKQNLGPFKNANTIKIETALFKEIQHKLQMLPAKDLN
jgi:hypothetical protein